MRRPLLLSLAALALIADLAWAPGVAAHGPAAAPAARPAGLTRLGAARFDGSRSAIEIPFSGPAPRTILYRLSATHYYYEFQRSRFTPGGAQYRKLGSNLERFTLANRPRQPIVRLSFRLTLPTVPAVSVDPASRRIKVLPLGREAALGSAPAIVPHGWSLPVSRPAATTGAKAAAQLSVR